MCELLGLCFNKEVTVQLAFSGLKAGATDNPDGWGVGWYNEYGTQVIKEARPVDRSRLARSFLEDGRSILWVTHDQAQAERMARRVLRIDEGVVREAAG